MLSIDSFHTQGIYVQGEQNGQLEIHTALLQCCHRLSVSYVLFTSTIFNTVYTEKLSTKILLPFLTLIYANISPVLWQRLINEERKRTWNILQSTLLFDRFALHQAVCLTLLRYLSSLSIQRGRDWPLNVIFGTLSLTMPATQHNQTAHT